MDFASWFRKIDEGLLGSSFRYVVPSDKETALYDFYMSDILDTYAKRLGGQNKGDFKPTHVDDEAKMVVQEVREKLLPGIKADMLNAVFFSICCEMRHIIVNNSPGMIYQRTPKELQPIIRKYLERMGVYRSWANHADARPVAGTDNAESKGASEERMNSYRAAVKAGDRAQFVAAAKSLFSGGTDGSIYWSASYGGRPWAGICDGWMNLSRATNLRDQSVYIDHLYDLQHNTGSVFNKVTSWYKDGYEWLAKALDHKRDVEHEYELLPHVSGPMKRLASVVIKAATGKTVMGYQNEKEAAVKATEDEKNRKKQELEEAMKRMVGRASIFTPEERTDYATVNALYHVFVHVHNLFAPKFANIYNDLIGLTESLAKQPMLRAKVLAWAKEYANHHNFLPVKNAISLAAEGKPSSAMAEKPTEAQKDSVEVIAHTKGVDGSFTFRLKGDPNYSFVEVPSYSMESIVKLRTQNGYPDGKKIISYLQTKEHLSEGIAVAITNYMISQKLLPSNGFASLEDDQFSSKVDVVNVKVYPAVYGKSGQDFNFKLSDGHVILLTHDSMLSFLKVQDFNHNTVGVAKKITQLGYSVPQAMSVTRYMQNHGMLAELAKHHIDEDPPAPYHMNLPTITGHIMRGNDLVVSIANRTSTPKAIMPKSLLRTLGKFKKPDGNPNRIEMINYLRNNYEYPKNITLPLVLYLCKHNLIPGIPASSAIQ